MKSFSVKILLVWLVLLTVLYSLLSILRHDHFQSGAFDLGIYDQAVWQYSRLIWPYNTIKDRFILGDHLTLTLPLLAPLYRFWPDPRVLFILQAFWLSFSALAVYKLALLRRLSGVTAAVLAIVYSLFYGIQFLVFFDFHPVAIGVGLLIWTAYFLEAGKKKLLVLSVVLLLLTQENMGIALAGLGLIYIFRKTFRTAAVIFIVLGLVSSLTAAKIISYLSPVGFQYQPQISLNLPQIIREFFDAPEKRQVWFYSFAGFSLLPIFSPGAVLAVTLDLAQYFVTGPEFARMWSPYMHHRAILVVFLVLGTLEVLEFVRKRKWNVNALVLGLVIITFGQQYVFHFPLNKLAKKDYWRTEQWMKDEDALIKLVPSGAGVAAQDNLVPHLAHRSKIYLVYPREHDFLFPVTGTETTGIKARIGNPGNIPSPCGTRSCWWLDFPDKPEYLVVDTRPDQWLTQILETNEHWLAAIGNMEKAGKITLDREVGSAKLYSLHY